MSLATPSRPSLRRLLFGILLGLLGSVAVAAAPARASTPPTPQIHFCGKTVPAYSYCSNSNSSLYGSFLGLAVAGHQTGGGRNCAQIDVYPTTSGNRVASLGTCSQGEPRLFVPEKYQNRFLYRMFAYAINLGPHAIRLDAWATGWTY